MTPIIQLTLRRVILAALLLLTLVGTVTTVAAQEDLPQNLIRQVGFDQKLDNKIPLDLEFTDSTNQQVQLKQYFDGEKPVVLSLGYYECPMLCSLVRNGMFEALKELEFTIGEDYQVLVVSIDPGETAEVAEAKRRASIIEYERSTSPEGWNFLVGQEESIKQLADAIGFQYAYDPKIDQYAHPSGIVILTPNGKVARYFYGIEFPTQNLRLGLVEAAENKIGSPVDQFLLTCYHYDPVSGEYTLTIMNIIRVIGLLTVSVIGGFVFVMLRRDWGNGSTPHPA